MPGITEKRARLCFGAGSTTVCIHSRFGQTGAGGEQPNPYWVESFTLVRRSRSGDVRREETPEAQLLDYALHLAEIAHRSDACGRGAVEAARRQLEARRQHLRYRALRTTGGVPDGWLAVVSKPGKQRDLGGAVSEAGTVGLWLSRQRLTPKRFQTQR